MDYSGSFKGPLAVHSHEFQVRLVMWLGVFVQPHSTV